MNQIKIVAVLVIILIGISLRAQTFENNISKANIGQKIDQIEDFQIWETAILNNDNNIFIKKDGDYLKYIILNNKMDFKKSHQIKINNKSIKEAKKKYVDFIIIDDKIAIIYKQNNKELKIHTYFADIYIIDNAISEVTSIKIMEVPFFNKLWSDIEIINSKNYNNIVIKHYIKKQEDNQIYANFISFNKLFKKRWEYLLEDFKVNNINYKTNIKSLNNGALVLDFIIKEEQKKEYKTLAQYSILLSEKGKVIKSINYLKDYKLTKGIFYTLDNNIFISIANYDDVEKSVEKLLIFKYDFSNQTLMELKEIVVPFDEKPQYYIDNIFVSQQTKDIYIIGEQYRESVKKYVTDFDNSKKFNNNTSYNFKEYYRHIYAVKLTENFDLEWNTKVRKYQYIFYRAEESSLESSKYASYKGFLVNDKLIFVYNHNKINYNTSEKESLTTPKRGGIHTTTTLAVSELTSDGVITTEKLFDYKGVDKFVCRSRNTILNNDNEIVLWLSKGRYNKFGVMSIK